MTEQIIAGILFAGVGLGVVYFVVSLKRKPTPLSQIISILNPNQIELDEAESIVETGKPMTGMKKTLGSMGFKLLKKTNAKSISELEQKLYILERSLERHCYTKMLGLFVGLFLPLGLWGVLLAIGASASVGIFIALAIALAAFGYWYPDIPLSEQVEKRKRAFRYAFSSYLDLVTVMLAGGVGIETALTASADAGGGWVFDLIRRALLRSRLSNETPWFMFAQLGKSLGVNELSELAASISLAGTQGARIRESLLAKADSLRSAQQAEIERDAESRSEKMTIPVLVMVVGLILFIGYGAVQAITLDTLPAISGIITIL